MKHLVFGVLLALSPAVVSADAVFLKASQLGNNAKNFQRVPYPGEPKRFFQKIPYPEEQMRPIPKGALVCVGYDDTKAWIRDGENEYCVLTQKDIDAILIKLHLSEEDPTYTIARIDFNISRPEGAPVPFPYGMSAFMPIIDLDASGI